MSWIEHRYADRDALADAVATALHAAVMQHMATQPQAMLALAGGGTPWPVYTRLAAMHLPWQRITLLPGDERCVPHTHPACNVRAMREVFATAQGVHVQPLTVAGGEPDASQAFAQRWLQQHSDPFAAAVLGMGGDGHTASLFPGAPQLPAALDPQGTQDALRIDPQPLPPEAPFPRITLTLPRLLRTDALHLILTGDAKRRVLEDAMHVPTRYPIGAVLHAPDRVTHIHWSP